MTLARGMDETLRQLRENRQHLDALIQALVNKEGLKTEDLKTSLAL